MATRLYFPASSAASETTTQDAGWNYTAELSRHNLSATKGSSAIGAGTLIGALSGTATHKGVDRMYFSPALAAQTISGTVSMMLMTREGAGTDNIDRPWMAVFVVNSSGAKVATLLALGVQTGAATTEWVANATHRTCTFANAANLSSYACAAGDKILVEIGGGNNASGTSPEFSCKWGENATDATLGDNATTADRAGWIEFSANLTYPATPVPGALVGASASTGTLLGTLAKLAALVGDGASTGALAAWRGILVLLTAVATSAGALAGLLGKAGLLPAVGVSAGTMSGTIEEDTDDPVLGALNGVALTSGTLAGVVGKTATIAGDAAGDGTLAGAVAVPASASGAATSSGTMAGTIQEAAPPGGCCNGGRSMGLGMGL